MQHLPGQQHPGRLAADFAATDAPVADHLQIVDGEDLFRQPDERQVIADHAFDQHDDDLAHVVFDFGLLVRLEMRQPLALVEQQVPRRDLRVEGQAHFAIGHAVVQRVGQNFLEQRIGQVVGEVEIGEVGANVTHALVPVGGRLLAQRLDDAFALLRLNRLLEDLALEGFLRDDAPVEDLLTQPLCESCG